VGIVHQNVLVQNMIYLVHVTSDYRFFASDGEKRNDSFKRGRLKEQARHKISIYGIQINAAES
jgi:hypothetical protein